ncbi:MAG: response regulator [Rhizobiaceae bacterium]|nr:response regulator [Rhizobiaceae bacterium]
MTTTKVLIVEDYAPLADSLEYQLKRAGYEVSRASDGREAVNLAKLTLPDVIILDVDLPSLSGIEVCRLVRSEPSTKDTLLLMLRAMGEANALADRNRSTPARDIFSRLNRDYAVNFAQADGRIPATFEAITLTGWAPSADQPQPLRPGSAQTRLAQALGTEEFGPGH